MHYKYNIAFYVDQNGKRPVEDYLFSEKNLTDITVMINVIQRLALIGQEIINTKMAKEIKNPIYELRKNRHRIFYVQDGKRFILLSAFFKETKKTPQNEILRAEEYYADYQISMNYLMLKLPPPMVERN